VVERDRGRGKRGKKKNTLSSLELLFGFLFLAADATKEEEKEEEKKKHSQVVVHHL